eukprot:3246890-Prymnesium_polylepis.1
MSWSIDSFCTSGSSRAASTTSHSRGSASSVAYLLASMRLYLYVAATQSERPPNSVVAISWPASASSARSGWVSSAAASLPPSARHDGSAEHW